MIDALVASMPDRAVDLSKTDRLMLINQFRILEILDKDNTEDHLRHATILREGFAGEYYDVFSGIAEELSREECGEVLDTLKMYSALQHAHETAGSGEISADEVRFPGYCGNNESRRRSYCKFLAEDLSVVAEEPHFTAHGPYSETYGRMLTAWRAIDSGERGRLTAEQVRAILNAGQRRELGEGSPVNFTVLPRRKD